MSYIQPEDNRTNKETLKQNSFDINAKSSQQNQHMELQDQIVRLKEDLEEERQKVRQLNRRLHDAEVMAQIREQEVDRLKREIDKFRSVLDIKTSKSTLQPLSALIEEDTENIQGIPGRSTTKRLGVSGESPGSMNFSDLPFIEKNAATRRLIVNSIGANPLLKNLSQTQVKKIVECMYEKTFRSNDYIIQEGDVGQHLYVAAEGEFHIHKKGVYFAALQSHQSFGELALLYECPRTASIIAKSDCRVWVLDRKIFQKIMMITNIQQTKENLQFLQSVPLLTDLSQEKLMKISDALIEETYQESEFIVREMEIAKTFFIIKSGKVEVTQMVAGKKSPQHLRYLQKGDYFGEKALYGNYKRTASVMACTLLEVLALDQEDFLHLIGDLNELRDKDYSDTDPNRHKITSKREDDANTSSLRPISKAEPIRYKYTKQDLIHIATLGVGGFGRVDLVQPTSDKSITFALKALKKQHIVLTKQEMHTLAEKNILAECQCDFIVRLYNSFKDSRFLYMLLEFCPGGEIWTLLRDRSQFPDSTTKFILACVMEALDYLHNRGIIYRDLKPENLLLDLKGYVKLCDFGFAKKIGRGKKTFTFCGTPEYVAPEVILNKGHDFAADYWSLGVLLYELLVGNPPFTGFDPMMVYNVILKGIDALEFPRVISQIAGRLIKRLCVENAAERLGYGSNGLDDVREHKYFQGFDWSGVRSHSLVSPIIPKVNGVCDASNFDQYPADDELPEEDLTGWDAEY